MGSPSYVQEEMQAAATAVAAVEEEAELSRPCVECEVPRELLLHKDHLIPPLGIGFERLKKNIWKIWSSSSRRVTECYDC